MQIASFTVHWTLAKVLIAHYVKYFTWMQQREAEFEEEQERIKKEKEKEVARLRTLQERARDHQAEQDALRAKRNQVFV